MAVPLADSSAGDRQVPTLEAEGVTKVFGGTRALSDFSITVLPAEIHALAGENGSGKSTLIKILSGYHVPDRGSMHIAGEPLAFGDVTGAARLGCRFVHQNLGLIDDLSVFDNMFLPIGFPKRFGGVHTRSGARIAAENLEKVGVRPSLSATVRSLPQVERTGVAIARALCDATEIPLRLLVLDEPTATLPANEVSHLLDMVRNVASHGVSVVYVTHRLDELFAVADRVTIVRDGQRVATTEADQLQRRQLITLMTGHEPRRIAENSAMAADRSGSAVLHVAGLASNAVARVDLDVGPGEIVGIAGITGSGREALLGDIFGATGHVHAGEVAVVGAAVKPNSPYDAIQAGMAFLPSDRHRLGGVMEMTARENMTLGHLTPLRRRTAISRRRETTEVQYWMDRMAVRPVTAADLNLDKFSGGNQQKVLIAKWLRRQPKILLLDEPTQGVDVGAKSEIHAQLVELAATGVAVVVASTDVHELAEICTRVIALRDGFVAEELIRPDITTSQITQATLGEEA